MKFNGWFSWLLVWSPPIRRVVSKEDYLWPVFHNMKIFDSTITGDAVAWEMTISGVEEGVGNLPVMSRIK